VDLGEVLLQVSGFSPVSIVPPKFQTSSSAVQRMKSWSVRDSKTTEALQNNVKFQSVNNFTPAQCKYIKVNVNVALLAYIQRCTFTVIHERVCEFYSSFFVYLMTLSLLKTDDNTGWSESYLKLGPMLNNEYQCRNV
jgi:hypothetical protein